MRILWTVNLVPREVAQRIGLKSEVLGGWVESMALRLNKKEDIELAIACKTEKVNQFDETINGIRYFSLGYDGKTKLVELEAMCSDIIDKYNPEIIQVEGTEFLH